MNIGIIDYKMGNIASLQNSFNKIGKLTTIIKNADEIKKCDKLILPGVGAFGDAAEHLNEYGFTDEIKDFVKTGKSLFGICLGMQLLFKSSEESSTKAGLDLIDGEVIKFSQEKAKHQIKIPHMGWNLIKQKNNSNLFRDLDEQFYLYFVHSYYVTCPKKYHIGDSFYGEDFVSAVQKNNIFGLQPHPEKSHNIGLKILKNFIELG